MTDEPPNPDPTPDHTTVGAPGEPTPVGWVATHPDRVGPYRIIKPIGEGGFGAVYHAEQDEPIRRSVALKILKPGMDSRQVVARFEAERQALAMMSHSGIARVLDAGVTDDAAGSRPYVVMELVRGVPITDYCDRQSLSTEERVDLVVKVCDAVQHAHQKGVIHRDLKPSNVLVTMQDGEPVPKVIDFGVAKAMNQPLTDRTLFTEAHQLVGTPEYMSPEQAESSGLDVDTRTDVYALGVLLYELLTGSTPFEPWKLRQAGFGEIQRIIREEEPPRPSTRLSMMSPMAGRKSAAPESASSLAGIARARRTDPAGLASRLQGDLDWIVMRAIEKSPTRRYG